MTHHVYYFWQDRTPLYVGVTGDLSRRLRQHSASPWAIRATHTTSIAFDSEAEAVGAEVEQIGSLRPEFNRWHNPAHQSVLEAMDAADYSPAYLAAWDRKAAEAIDAVLSQLGVLS